MKKPSFPGQGGQGPTGGGRKPQRPPVPGGDTRWLFAKKPRAFIGGPSFPMPPAFQPRGLFAGLLKQARRKPKP
jgi:hypothetical protein